MVLYAQPDGAGQVCPTLINGFFPPLNPNGDAMIGEVARVTGADDF
jgi:hypothetical protein